MATSIFFCCDRCTFRCKEKVALVKHIFEAHSTDANFTYSCPIEGCPHVFKLGCSYSSFRSHVTRKHHDWKDQLAIQAAVTSTEDATHGIGEPMETGLILDPSGNGANESAGATVEESAGATLEESGPSSLSKSAAHFLLTLKEKYGVAQSVVDFAVGSMNQMLDHVCDELQKSVETCMHENEITPPRNLSECFAHTNPFSHLETEYQQAKYYREHFGLVEPVTIELGSLYCYQRSGTKSRLIEKKETFQYIPLIENLQCVLQNKEIYSEVIKNHARNDLYLEDFCDGTMFKTHPIFAYNPLALQLVIYYDEVELCNPLGSHRGVHKIALFYYVLGNLHPKLRSTLRCIQLIAAVTYPNLIKYGFKKVLQPFIEDAKKLSNGTHITIGDQDIPVKGAVFLMLADTVAAHSIGGFKVGVGFALRKCRNCMATAETMAKMFKEEDFVLRTPSSYDYHCSLLTGPLASSDSTTYGVNFISPLNDLEHFHVANSQLPQDVMHIMLEGVLPYEVKLMLTVFIKEKKYFTIDLLNERIKCYPYTQEEIGDRPSPIALGTSSSQLVIHQSAAQMWMLAIYLPLIVGSEVPPEEPLWECFLLLIDILQITTARILSPGLAAYLGVLIHDHHNMFRHCYPTASIIPKMHYMVHFPSQILKLGPLVSSWCMRMEAKNSYFKRIAQLGNFRNIVYSVAKRHQRLMCSYLQSHNFFSTTTECGPAKDPIPLCSEPRQQDLKLLVPGAATDCLVYRPKWIRCQGTVYRLAQFVLSGWQDDDLPQFSKIEQLISIQNVAIMVAIHYHTVGIDRHYHSYLIGSTRCKSVIPLANVDSHPPVNVRALPSGMYLTLRYHVLNVSCTSV